MQIKTFTPHSLGGMPTEITNRLLSELGGYHSPLADMYLGKRDFYWIATKPVGEMLSFKRRLSIVHPDYSRENAYESVETSILAIGAFRAPQIMTSFEVRIWTPTRHEDCANAAREVRSAAVEYIQSWASDISVSCNH